MDFMNLKRYFPFFSFFSFKRSFINPLSGIFQGIPETLLYAPHHPQPFGVAE